MSGYTDDCYFVPDSNDHGAIMEDKEEEERAWTNTDIDAVALGHLPNIDMEKSLGRAILFSTWLSKNYILMKSDELRDYTFEPKFDKASNICEEYEAKGCYSVHNNNCAAMKKDKSEDQVPAPRHC